MKRLARPMLAFLKRLFRPLADRLLAKLRAHVALAVNDDLLRLAVHVSNERANLTAELTKQIAEELAPLRRQLDDVSVCNEGLLREVVRLQREVRQLLDSFEQLSCDGEMRPVAEHVGGGETFRKVA
jgi:hypothetical protein